MTELDLSADRLFEGLKYKTSVFGFGTTSPGQTLVRQYREQLATEIVAERGAGRFKPIWRTLRGIDADALAIRLLTAGITAAEGLHIGTDKHGEKHFREQALWIGLNFGQRGELGFSVGYFCIRLLLRLPIFGLDHDDVLRLKTNATDLMDEVLANSLQNNPLLSPITVPPEDWTQVRKGGLPADHWAKAPLIREHHPSIEAAARKAIGTKRMQGVLDAINALQSVPFCINQPVLDFMLRLGPPDAPALQEIRPRAWQQGKFRKWMKEYGQVRGFHIDTTTARTIAEVERFWVPLNIDFRGRINGIPHFNFTRHDAVRGLFLFAQGERIGEQGLKWLKCHVAGVAKGNKFSPVIEQTFEDRIAWTDANLPMLRIIGETVLHGGAPATIAWALPEKNPYEFLAACAELVQALDQGPEFKTRLPLTFDASCSGLQHLCAITRSEKGWYVNLTDDEDQQDFYGRVAHRVWKIGILVTYSHWGLFPTSPVDLGLMKNPLDREIVKQPAMSYFYGARPGGWQQSKDGRWRPFGMTEQVIDVLEDRNKSTRFARELAQAIYDAIEDTVPAAVAVRDSLEQLSDLCSDNEKPLRWTTPLGLSVINRYHKPKKKRISIPLNGRRRRINFVIGDQEKPWKKKAINSVTANFVHSLDAALLHFIALTAAKEGIPLVTVHDCFGCLAPHAERLNGILREQFVHLHEDHDLLDDVWASARRDLPAHVTLPSIPPIGSLDIKGVLTNFHAFRS